jgi:hypothetical protein
VAPLQLTPDITLTEPSRGIALTKP